ncbi:uncharacterized protein EV420DRAFT_1576576 [Desarmillaria tabescens]|uniref:F-box domain-containing protein n=1 Tax=Armillaria tabescens TaxID=1929756 RepID=A0AA39JIG7_ARMTA|nr:uncharacterized protein EV420DRAFT_1576576 [Desarmillaria tabescens]KAK0443376.1 hypothetical protein EV420DRAFT_1576576 [Desarmillaria tabescens]
MSHRSLVDVTSPQSPVLSKRRPFVRTPLLLSLPTELLERIIYESCNTGRRALRCTCMLLCRFATPFVFETLVIDTETMSLSNSRDRLRFFRALASGKTFTRYVRYLHLISLELPEGRCTLVSLDRRRRERNSKKLEELLVAAIPLMTSLRGVQYDGVERRLRENGVLWDQIRSLPSISMFSWIGYPVPITNFPHLTQLSIRGHLFSRSVAILISNSPHLSSLSVLSTNFPGYNPSVLAFFRQYPPGKYSSITNLSLCGNLAVFQSDVPLLIPHLCQLQSLELSINFVASEFWASLQAERIFVRRLSLSLLRDDPMLFDYLCSYSGLDSLFLLIRRGSGEATQKGMERVRERHGEMLQKCEPPGLQFGEYDAEDNSWSWKISEAVWMRKWGLDQHSRMCGICIL